MADQQQAPADYQPPNIEGAGQPVETGYRGRHPLAALFHILFKLGAIIAWLLGMFSISYVSIFISVTLFLAADFWTVKNVTGRLMVGLRWWNQVKEDGDSEWIFESSVDAQRVDKFDSYFFWVTTYGTVIIWGVFTFFSITKLSWLPLALLGLILNGSNAYGYTKCRRDAKKKMTQFFMQHAARNPNLVAQATGLK